MKNCDYITKIINKVGDKIDRMSDQEVRELFERKKDGEIGRIILEAGFLKRGKSQLSDFPVYDYTKEVVDKIKHISSQEAKALLVKRHESQFSNYTRIGVPSSYVNDYQFPLADSLKISFKDLYVKEPESPGISFDKSDDRLSLSEEESELCKAS